MLSTYNLQQKGGHVLEQKRTQAGSEQTTTKSPPHFVGPQSQLPLILVGSSQRPVQTYFR